jgi:hypothetical protein
VNAGVAVSCLGAGVCVAVDPAVTLVLPKADGRDSLRAGKAGDAVVVWLRPLLQLKVLDELGRAGTVCAPGIDVG